MRRRAVGVTEHVRFQTAPALTRTMLERAFEEAKQEAGLDDYEVRR